MRHTTEVARLGVCSHTTLAEAILDSKSEQNDRLCSVRLSTACLNRLLCSRSALPLSYRLAVGKRGDPVGDGGLLQAIASRIICVHLINHRTALLYPTLLS